jgi:hypothetical protein
VPALCASGELVRVFADARGGAGLFVTVRKVSNGSVIVHRSRGQSGASSVYSSGGFVKVFADARGAVSLRSYGS